VAFAGGMTFVLAALTVYLRDLAQLTGFIATVMLFLSPVFYPLENAPAGWQQWLLLNPVTIPIEVTRSLILKDQWPNPTYWALHTVASFVALYAGWWVFQRTRRGFADVV
jgi:lipopolysaccharide transport system permease protein